MLSSGVDGTESPSDGGSPRRNAGCQLLPSEKQAWWEAHKASGRTLLCSSEPLSLLRK
jgi:hypothetical protein